MKRPIQNPDPKPDGPDVVAPRPVHADARRNPVRADARRNHERLLTAAEAAFAAAGVDASLEDIARRAGVGIATLYRNFPTREALLAALLHDRIAELAARGRALADTADPGDALDTWLEAMAAHAATYRGLAASLTATAPVGTGERSMLSASCDTLLGTAARLLARAQAAGQACPDAQVDDVVTIVHAIAWAAAQAPADPERVTRLLTLLLRGLRCDGPDKRARPRISARAQEPPHERTKERTRAPRTARSPRRSRA